MLLDLSISHRSDLPAFLVAQPQAAGFRSRSSGHVIESRSCDLEWDPNPSIQISRGSAQEDAALACLRLEHVVLRTLN